jgi:hypothetical protein
MKAFIWPFLRLAQDNLTLIRSKTTSGCTYALVCSSHDSIMAVPRAQVAESRQHSKDADIL